MNDVLIVGGIFRETILGAGAAEKRIGGPGLLAAQAAAQQGASVVLAGFVGEEDLELAAQICGHADVVLEPAAVTGGASATFVLDRGAVAPPWPLLRPAVMPTRAMCDLSATQARIAVVFGSPGWDPWAEAGLRRVLERAEILMWDGQGFMSASADSADAAGCGAGVRIQLGNLDELAVEAGCEGGEALERLPFEGFHAAFAKDGRWGVTLLSGKGQDQIGAHPVEVLDAIGSGDVFAGTVAGAMAGGASMLEAGRAGASVAARLIGSARRASLVATLKGAPEAQTLPEPVWVEPGFVRGLHVSASAGRGPAGAALFDRSAAALASMGLRLSVQDAGGAADLRILLAGEEPPRAVPSVVVQSADMSELCLRVAAEVRQLWAARA